MVYVCLSVWWGEFFSFGFFFLSGVGLGFFWEVLFVFMLVVVAFFKVFSPQGI